MGPFARKLAESRVSFSGIREYAESGLEDRPIRANAVLTERRRFDGKIPLLYLGPLGAVRLLSMLRREPHYVFPFMALVEAAGRRLRTSEASHQFRMRDCVETNPQELSEEIERARYGSDAQAEYAVRMAELNSSIPIVMVGLTRFRGHLTSWERSAPGRSQSATNQTAVPAGVSR